MAASAPPPDPQPDDARIELFTDADGVLHVVGIAAEDLARCLRTCRPGDVDVDVVVHHCPSTTTDSVNDADLTPREIDIVRQIAMGRSNREVADELYLGINTVKTYIRSAYRKMGVRTRPQAVIWALRNGLGPPAAEGRQS